MLAATSNPQATALQTAIIGRGPHDGSTVAAGIVGDVGMLNRQDGAPQALGSFGVVIGATVALADYRIEPAWLRGMPVLAPGFGEQGGRLEDVAQLFGEATGSVVANVARSAVGDGAAQLPSRLDAASTTLAGAIGT